MTLVPHPELDLPDSHPHPQKRAFECGCAHCEDVYDDGYEAGVRDAESGIARLESGEFPRGLTLNGGPEAEYLRWKAERNEEQRRASLRKGLMRFDRAVL